ncbi:hypothetical protein TNCT_670071 [Trichonephila clavata]|uniref:Uncharacterized protein n=1 Tax=Trichonephila clavata TaxID=2740835 RepID=A0A8X6HCI7_TRICU|nr:hypothetical protein TNCT_670071 [Trichonephila clavata]
MVPKMIAIVCLVCISISFSSAVPLYGRDGGYSGYASYVPTKNSVGKAGHHSEDSIHASAGSPGKGLEKFTNKLSILF